MFTCSVTAMTLFKCVLNLYLKCRINFQSVNPHHGINNRDSYMYNNVTTGIETIYLQVQTKVTFLM